MNFKTGDTVIVKDDIYKIGEVANNLPDKYLNKGSIGSIVNIKGLNLRYIHIRIGNQIFDVTPKEIMLLSEFREKKINTIIE